MIDIRTLDKYLRPESPWIRDLFAQPRKGLGNKLDDATSRRLAALTGWKPRDDKGHRYHNALAMMNIMPHDNMYHHMYDFVRGWGQEVEKWERDKRVVDDKVECFAYFNLYPQFERSNLQGLNTDDMISIAIMTELTKQGRRDFARAVIDKAKGLLEEEAYLTSQASSRGLSGHTETGDAQAGANRIMQKRMGLQGMQPKTPHKDREMTEPPRMPSRIPTPARGSSPMSLDGPSSSGKKQTASGGNSHRLSHSVTNTPARSSSPMSLSAPGSSGKKQTSNAESHPSITMSHKLPRSGANTPAMTPMSRPRSRQSIETTRPDSNSENEDYDSYMSRKHHRPDPDKELARMERRAATTPAHTGGFDSPLAYKAKTRVVEADKDFTESGISAPRTGNISPRRAQLQPALRKNQARALARPKASTADITGGRSQDDISTDSGGGSEEEHQRRPPGGGKKKGRAGDVPLSPTKRSKDSPSAHPPSPPKKSRVSSKMTDRSISPIGAIVISDHEEAIICDDDEIRERQPDDTRAGRDVSDEDDDPVPPPDID